MTKRFVICSPQEEYAGLLAEHIAERGDLAFELYVCTTYSALVEEQQKKKIDILLVDGSVPEQKRDRIKAKQIYVLSNGNQKAGKQEKEVYQFQPAHAIISEILEGCVEQKDGSIFKPPRKGDRQLIGIYSPIHRIGKSEFALNLSRELGRYKQVLYMNLEEYSVPGEELFLEKRTLSDLLYYMRQDDGYLGGRVGTIVRRFQEVDMIAPIPVSQDLKEVTAADWRILFQRLLEESMYELIIVDFSESVQGLFDLLSMCDTVYQPTIQDMASQVKLRQYQQVVKRLGYDALLTKTVEVSMEQDNGKAVRSILANYKRRKTQ